MMMIILNIRREDECALPHSLQASKPSIYLDVSNNKFCKLIASELQLVK